MTELLTGDAADKIDRLTAEIERLREAKRLAGLIADERSRENVALRAALKPFADCVYNDNGDVTVTYGTVVPFDYFRAYRVLRDEAHEQGANNENDWRRHDYVPSAMHMGDCAKCGHPHGADIHKRSQDTQ